MVPHSITPYDGPVYVDVKYFLEMYVQQYAAKQGCVRHDNVSGIEIRLKTWLYAIPESRFVVETTTDGVLFYDVASRLAEVIVAEFTVYVYVNVIELFGQALFVLQTIPFLVSMLVTRL